MPILTKAGIEYLNGHISALESLVPAASSATASTSTSSTSTATESTPSVARQMLTGTIDMLKRLAANNSIEYWNKKENNKALIATFRLLDADRYTYVPVVFNAESRALGGKLLEVLNGLDLEKHLDSSCSMALKAALKISGGSPKKFITMLRDNLSLNIKLYDVVAAQRNNEQKETQLQEYFVAPAKTYLTTALQYIEHVNGTQVIRNCSLQQLADMRKTLELPDDCVDIDNICKFIAGRYRSKFANLGHTMDALPVAYSHLHGLDDVIIRKDAPHPLTKIGENGSTVHPFHDAGLYGRKSYWVRQLLVLEVALTQITGKEFSEVSKHFGTKYNKDDAQKLQAKFDDMVKALRKELVDYREQAGENPVKGLFVKLTANKDKKAIADRLIADCDFALKPDLPDAAEKDRRAISFRCVGMLKAMLGESMLHAVCVGENEISFGRLGNAFNEHTLPFFDLFGDISFNNDPYVGDQIKKISEYVPQEHEAASSSASSMAKK